MMPPSQPSWFEHLDVVQVIMGTSFAAIIAIFGVLARFMFGVVKRIFDEILTWIKSQTKINEQLSKDIDNARAESLKQKEELERKIIAEKDEMNNRIIKLANRFDDKLTEQAEKMNIMQGEHNANHGG